MNHRKILDRGSSQTSKETVWQDPSARRETSSEKPEKGWKHFHPASRQKQIHCDYEQSRLHQQSWRPITVHDTNTYQVVKNDSVKQLENKTYPEGERKTNNHDRKETIAATRLHDTKLHPKPLLKMLLSLVTKHPGAKQQAQRMDSYQNQYCVYCDEHDQIELVQPWLPYKTSVVLYYHFKTVAHFILN